MKGSTWTLGLVAILVASQFGGIESTASAQWRPSGSASALVLLRESNPGPGLVVDLHESTGVFRWGGALGVGAITHPTADLTRVFMPVGASFALRIPMGRVFLHLGVRGGIWAGALNQGLFAGGWLSAQAGFEYALDDTVGIRAGVDAWYLMGRDAVLLYAPGLGLTWSLDSGET